MSNSTVSQLKKRISQLNRLIAKFPTVRSLIRKWVFELVVLEGELESFTAPQQLTIWDVKMIELDFSRPDLVENFGKKAGSGVIVFEDFGKGYFVGFKFGYEAKDKLKDMGAKWNLSEKAWCFPVEVSGNSQEEKLASFKASARKRVDEVIESFKDSLFSEEGKEYKIPCKSLVEF